MKIKSSLIPPNCNPEVSTFTCLVGSIQDVFLHISFLIGISLLFLTINAIILYILFFRLLLSLSNISLKSFCISI